MKYQAVVFDFDYTLGDSTEGILSSVRYGMERLGRGPMERESVRRTIGLSLQETYRALTGDSSGEQAEKFAAYFREQADKVMVGHTVPGHYGTAAGVKRPGHAGWDCYNEVPLPD